MTALSLVAAIGGTLVGAIGFAMSYSTLAKVAVGWGFSPQLAPWFPIGVDASIVAFLAMDLYLIRKNTPWPVLRLAAHTMTGATIWFNASSQGAIAADPVQAASHGIMPFLFVIGVEAARRLVIKKARLQAGTATDRIPVNRWVLAPLATPRFYRRMRLHDVRSYPEMIRRDQDLRAYEQWLSRKHKGDLDKASDDELLPMTMAKHGYTVKQALALPEQQEEAAAEREEAAQSRLREAETRRVLAEDQAEARKEQSAADLETVRAHADGQKGQARAHSRAQTSAAERAAQLEEQALDNAVIAEARARGAEAERQEALERQAAAAADLEAAELERQAAEKRKAAEQADLTAAAELQAIETEKTAKAKQAAAAADLEAAELERQAAEKRKAAEQADLTAAAELQAIETEKTAKAKQAAAEANKAAAEAARAAEAEKLAAAEIQLKTAQEASLAQAAKAEAKKAEQAAAEAAKATTEARLAADENELRAVEAEDRAKLTPRQRGVRKLARMAQAAGLNPANLTAREIHEQLCDLVSLADVQRSLTVSSTDTASKYRTEAAEFLSSGANPAA